MDLPPVGADGSLAERGVVGGQRLHLRHHRLAVLVGLQGLHRLQVVQHSGVDPAWTMVGIRPLWRAANFLDQARVASFVSQ